MGAGEMQPQVAAEIRLAAQDLLHTLFSCRGGRAINSEDEVLQALAIPMRRRQEFVNSIAQNRGVSQPAMWKYTVDQWRDWYSERLLSEPDMDLAVKQWKRDFPMQFHTREKIEALEEQDTRKRG